MNILDITPESLHTAAETTGLRLTDKCWASDICACALSITVIADDLTNGKATDPLIELALLDAMPQRSIMLYMTNKFEATYSDIESFTAGFDLVHELTARSYIEEFNSELYNHGVKCREALKNVN